VRGNNKRKLITEQYLAAILKEYQLSVPLAKLVKNHALNISTPHLRKLLFIYIDILDMSQAESNRIALRNAIFPNWLNGYLGVAEQPDEWTYQGKFPFGEWKLK